MCKVEKGFFSSWAFLKFLRRRSGEGLKMLKSLQGGVMESIHNKYCADVACISKVDVWLL